MSKHNKKILYFFIILSLDSLNFLSGHNFFGWTKSKPFSDDNEEIVAEVMISVFDRVQHIVSKGKNAGQFLFFQQSFQKISLVFMLL